MRPPECGLCGNDLEDLQRGLVSFAERGSDIEWRKRMKETGGVGHPPNVEWFCSNHYDLALSLSHLTIDKAFVEMREILGL
jgi:hypothetical protein